jgi:D-alanyl-D-alanine carboxypeptidase
MHRSIPILILLLSIAAGCFAQAGSSDDKSFLTKAEEYAGKLAAEDKFSGTILIAQNGKPVLTKSYGFADKEKQIPNGPDTIYNLGSINKLFTGLAIGMLADEGKLALNDTIGKHLPDYPNKEAAGKVTISQLLAMTSGIGDIFGPEYEAMDKSRLDSITAYLPLFASKPLEFEPGTGRRYSNGGYIVLGAIIEKASGMSYYDFVKQRIFNKCGMKDTESLRSDSKEPRMAKGYTTPTGTDKWVNNFDTLPRRGSSAGGGYSTVGDMLKFANAIENGTLKAPESLQKGERSMIAAMFKGGLGFAGGAPGINAIIESRLPGGYTLIVLSNYDPPSAIEVGKGIRALLGATD